MVLRAWQIVESPNLLNFFCQTLFELRVLQILFIVQRPFQTRSLTFLLVIIPLKKHYEEQENFEIFVRPFDLLHIFL